MHRSVLSFNINCSSPRLTPDGVDGIANGDPIAETLKTKLPEKDKTPLGAIWHADFTANNFDKEQVLRKEYLGAEFPWEGTSPFVTPADLDIPEGFNNSIVTKGKDYHNLDEQMSDSDVKLSIQVPNQIYEAGDYKFCGSAEKIKEHKKNDKEEAVSLVAAFASPSPDVTHEKHEAFPQPEICSKPEKIPSSLPTLREALEACKPNFISHSQERLKKIEHKVQQRKFQQDDFSEKKTGAPLSRKLSSTSISSKKKQYTVPHPLSDNLFKPKERFISEKEMHMRSRRIYNNLPEVKKKQEEKQKRVILQSNRLRAEVFKKLRLDAQVAAVARSAFAKLHLVRR
uniref:ALMS motif domain-containing protein n=1 Tax=Sphenodon punctatus TaxID=8508 RepID=A0A8D0HAC5_SPHPU